MTDLLRPDDTRDALRKVGGLVLGVGVLMLLLRKGDEYSDFVVFLLFATPAVFLYGVGVFTAEATGGLRSWQAVYSVFGLIFVPLALFQFIELIDGTPGDTLNVMWVFGVTAALAFYAGAVVGIRFHLLAGSIALIIAWSALWDELLSEGIAGDFGIYRGLLGILSIILLAGAIYLWREGREARVTGTAVEYRGDPGLWQASELFTGAGIAAVIGCSLGITSALELSPVPVVDFPIVDTTWVWDALLLAISLGLIAIGSLIGVRGPVYVGAIGLFLFLLIAGLDLDDETPDPANFGVWPIILLVGGGLALAASGVAESSLGDRPRKFVQKLRRG